MADDQNQEHSPGRDEIRAQQALLKLIHTVTEERLSQLDALQGDADGTKEMRDHLQQLFERLRSAITDTNNEWNKIHDQRERILSEGGPKSRVVVEFWSFDEHNEHTPGPSDRRNKSKYIPCHDELETVIGIYPKGQHAGMVEPRRRTLRSEEGRPVHFTSEELPVARLHDAELEIECTGWLLTGVMPADADQPLQEPVQETKLTLFPDERYMPEIRIRAYLVRDPNAHPPGESPEEKKTTEDIIKYEQELEARGEDRALSWHTEKDLETLQRLQRLVGRPEHTHLMNDQQYSSAVMLLTQWIDALEHPEDLAKLDRLRQYTNKDGHDALVTIVTRLGGGS